MKRSTISPSAWHMWSTILRTLLILCPNVIKWLMLWTGWRCRHWSDVLKLEVEKWLQWQTCKTVLYWLHIQVLAQMFPLPTLSLCLAKNTYLEKMLLHLLTAGHTKSAADWCSGLVKMACWLTVVSCVQELSACVSASQCSTQRQIWQRPITSSCVWLTLIPDSTLPTPC